MRCPQGMVDPGGQPRLPGSEPKALSRLPGAPPAPPWGLLSSAPDEGAR